MERRSHLSRAIASADDKAKYDAYVKEILSDKEILARILKYTTEEFKDYAPADIIPCIEEPEVSEIPVERGMTNMRIAGTSTENSTGNEGTISYDIRFSVITPGKERIKILVDAEAQNNYHPGYDLVTRGIFYAARMLSVQHDVEFTGDDYDRIKKCYSIWICTDVPKKYANTITRYKYSSENIFGNFSGKARYDLMTVVMIRLGDITSTNNLIRLLDTVLSSDLTAEKKENLLEHDFGIIPTIQRKGDLEEMCNLSSGLIEKGRQIGERIGFENGEKAGFENGEKTGFINGERSGFDKATRAIVHRTYERYRDYEMAALLADVSVDQVKKWLSENTEESL